MKWVDRELTPIEGGSRDHLAQLVAELQAQPGRWAEIARYDLHRLGSARSRGAQTKKRYPGVEYAVEREGDQFVLFFRATA